MLDKNAIGRGSPPTLNEVEKGAIRRFAEAIGDPNPLFNDEAAARDTRFGGMIAPPTFCRSLGSGIPQVKLDLPGFRALDGGSEWEYHQPIRPGDRITAQSRIADIRETAGRLGPMVFIVVETGYANQFGQLCVTQRSTVIRY